MKTLSKVAILSLSATMIASVASAQVYRPAYEVLDNLTSAQVTELKQLGQLSSNNYVNPIYDAKVERILTPEQNSVYKQRMTGEIRRSNSNDFNFNLDSK